MTAPSEEPGTAAATALGDRAYPESQVSHEGGTYWLERSAAGTKRLVALVPEESAGTRVRGERGCGRQRVPAGGRDHLGERAGAALRPALADAVPLRPAHLRGLRRPARARHPWTRPGAARGRRGDQPRVRPAVDPRDGPLRAYAVRRSRRRDLGGLPGGVDQPGRRGRRPSRGPRGHRLHHRGRFRLLHARPEGRGRRRRRARRRGDDPAEGRGPRLGRSGLRPGWVHLGVRRPTAGPGEHRGRAGRGVGAAGDGEVRPRRWPTRWRCTGG